MLLDLAPNAADADDQGREQQARELARQLGYLPLALHLAGTYLGNPGGRYKSFDAYRRALDEGVGLLAPPGIARDDP